MVHTEGDPRSGMYDRPGRDPNLRIGKVGVGSVSTKVNHVKAWDTKLQTLAVAPWVAGLPKDR